MKSVMPAALDDSSQKKLDKLRDTKPEDYAGQHDPMQVTAHKDAVALPRAATTEARGRMGAGPSAPSRNALFI
jgi:hypothetical protein